MMEYIIISARNIFSLENFVNQRIRAGWKTQGGVCYAGESFMQAMIKDTP